MTGCDSRASLTPGLLVEAFEANTGTPATNAKDVTAEKCSETISCREAVQTEEIAIYRFDEKEDAAAFTQTLGNNGFQGSWIVLEYENAALDTDRAKVSYATILDGTWSSDLHRPGQPARPRTENPGAWLFAY